ncbi:MAG: hypothetical protein U9R34_00830 [Nanoarchaeota archaeon]|nr:hypothetical protein [Nanoarchaeota archaeon]
MPNNLSQTISSDIKDYDYNFIIFKSYWSAVSILPTREELEFLSKDHSGLRFGYKLKYPTDVSYDLIEFSNKTKLKLILHNDPNELLEFVKNSSNKTSAIIYDVNLIEKQEINESNTLFKLITDIKPKIKHLFSFSKFEFLGLKSILDNEFQRPIGEYYMENVSYSYAQELYRSRSKGMIKEYLKLQSYKNELIGLGVDGFIADFRTIADYSEVLPFIKSVYTESPSKLYIVLGPTGYGKSTLINQLKHLGIRQMTKVMTRQYRTPAEMLNPCLESISMTEFEKLVKIEQIIGHHVYNGNGYGFKKEQFEKIPKSNRNYILDSCDFNSAYALKSKYPDNIKLVAIFPSLTFAGFGLENRIYKLKTPYDKFSNFTEELDYLKKSEKAILNTKERFDYVALEAQNFRQYLSEMDIVLDSINLETNVNSFLDKIND